MSAVCSSNRQHLIGCLRAAFTPATIARIVTFVAGATIVLSGCSSKNKSAPLAAAPQGLTLSGHVVDGKGIPVSGVLVYIEDEAQPRITTNANGIYSIHVSEDDLLRLDSTRRNASTTFQLYFESFADTSLVAASAPIDLAERGHRELAATTLTAGATVSGKVLQLGGNHVAEPAAGAKVRMGRAVVEAQTDGSFTLKPVPVGLTTVSADAARYASAEQNIELATGGEYPLPRPLVLFPDGELTGYVTMLEPVDLTQLVASGHPFLRKFIVHASHASRFIRYSHTPESLAIEPWRPVSPTFDYDFPQDGGNLLFYQFADASQTAISGAYKLTVRLDQFGETKGIVIENGSGLVTRRNVLVHVDVPAAAYRMRLAETPEELYLKPWRQPQQIVEYTFELRRNIFDGLLEPFGQRTLYCQFADAFGIESPAYQATVTIDLFPLASSEVFVINGGAPQTEDQLVRLDIRVPPNAYEMRIYQPDIIDQSGWLAASPIAYFSFQIPGIKTLYVQFRSIDGILSPAYQQVIRVLPFQQIDTGFVINGGAPLAISRLLTIDLIPPYTAIAFRIIEQDQPVPGPWLSLVPRTLYRAMRSGEIVLQLQYLSHDFQESPFYSQSIVVDPFPPDSGDFIIDGGAIATNDPTLHLSIAAPPNAVAMQAYEGISANDPNFDIFGFPVADPDWFAIAPTLEIPVSPGTGVKLVSVRFRDVNGDESGLIQKAIFYDPFPVNAQGVLIDRGAATTDDNEVELTFFGGPSLSKVRVTTDPDEFLADPPFVERPLQMKFTLPGTSGLHRIYVQFQTITGENSPMYFADIVKN